MIEILLILGAVGAYLMMRTAFRWWSRVWER